MVNESEKTRGASSRAKAQSASSRQGFRPRLRAFSDDKENPPRRITSHGKPAHSLKRNGTFLERNKAIETDSTDDTATPRRKGTPMTANGTSAVTERSAPSARLALPVPARIDWVDYAKGICIVMVVMMHSVLGVEAAAGAAGLIDGLVAFAKPFRMPDFFLISGLFLAVVINRDWRTYLDRKVVHFAYFYLLWVTIQFGFKAPSFAAESGWSHVGLMYLESFIEPFGTLWFIYLLPVFFVVTKATRKLPPVAIWGVTALLEMAHIGTGWTVIDEFCARFVYFYSGYLFARNVFALSDRARARPGLALAALAAWAMLNGSLVGSGFSEWPLISLALGLAGAGAIVTLGTLLARAHWLNFLRFC